MRLPGTCNSSCVEMTVLLEMVQLAIYIGRLPLELFWPIMVDNKRMHCQPLCYLPVTMHLADTRSFVDTQYIVCVADHLHSYISQAAHTSAHPRWPFLQH